MYSIYPSILPYIQYMSLHFLVYILTFYQYISPPLCIVYIPSFSSIYSVYPFILPVYTAYIPSFYHYIQCLSLHFTTIYSVYPFILPVYTVSLRFTSIFSIEPHILAVLAVYILTFLLYFYFYILLCLLILLLLYTFIFLNFTSTYSKYLFY